MHPHPSPSRFLFRPRLAAAALALGLAGLAMSSHALPLGAYAFEGEGNVSVFDAGAGTGGWAGTVRGFAGEPELVSVVTFQFDASTGWLNGLFEFTRADDLASGVFGTLMGQFTDPTASLSQGGQWSLDYQFTGGFGDYVGTSGVALSFLTFDPMSMADNNYMEQGLLVPVPEPTTTWLLAAGLLTLAGLAARRNSARRPSSTAPLS